MGQSAHLTTYHQAYRVACKKVNCGDIMSPQAIHNPHDGEAEWAPLR